MDVHCSHVHRPFLVMNTFNIMASKKTIFPNACMRYTSAPNPQSIDSTLTICRGVLSNTCPQVQLLSAMVIRSVWLDSYDKPEHRQLYTYTIATLKFNMGQIELTSIILVLHVHMFSATWIHPDMQMQRRLCMRHDDDSYGHVRYI